MTTIDDFLTAPNDPLDYEDRTWYRSEGPFVRALYIREQVGYGLKNLTTCSVYVPRNGGTMTARVERDRSKGGDRFQANADGSMTLEDLLRWCADESGIKPLN